MVYLYKNFKKEKYMVVVGKQPQPKNGDVSFMSNTDGLTECYMYHDGH